MPAPTLSLSVFAEGELDWNAFLAAVELPPLPAAFPLPTGGRLRISGDVSSDGGFTLRAVADVEMPDAASLWGIPVGTTARFEFRSDSLDPSASSPAAGLRGKVLLHARTRLPALPTIPGLVVVAGNDEVGDGWVDIRFIAEADSEGHLRVGAEIDHPLAVTLQLPGLAQPEAPIRAWLDAISLSLAIDDGASALLEMSGGFELRPLAPPAGLPVTQYLAPLFAAQPTLSGRCSLRLGMQGEAPSIALDATLDDAGFEFDLFDMLSRLSRGLGGPPGTTAEVPLEANFGFRLLGVGFAFAAPATGAGADSDTGPGFSVALRLAVSFGEIEAVGGFQLSDGGFAIGLERMVLPLAMPRFPLTRDEFLDYYDDADWELALDARLALWDGDLTASGQRARSRLEMQRALMRGVLALRGDGSAAAGYQMSPGHAQTYRAWLSTLFGALDTLTSVGAEADGGGLATFSLTPHAFEQLRAAFVPSAILDALEPLAGMAHGGESAFLAALEGRLGAEAVAAWRSPLLRYALRRGACFEATIDGERHAVAEDLSLVLRDILFVVPFDAPRDIGVSGTASLAGFVGPYDFLNDVGMTLGLSADLIYFSLEAADGRIPIPDVGRYTGGSINLSEFRLGFGYSKRSLAVAFSGGIVLPRQLVEDLDTSDVSVAGVRLPVQSRLSFRFELMPVPVVKVLPLLQFDLDLRQDVSPGLTDSRLCLPHWDGLQVIVPGVVRASLKRAAFSPLFACVPAPNVAFAGDLVIGDARNGVALIIDDLLVIGPVTTSSMPVPIPGMCDYTPFVANLCVGVRIAGFAVNFNIQRPFPSFSPMALIEVLALFSDPENYRVDPHGELANCLRVTLKDAWVVLPEPVKALLPGGEALVRRPIEITVNLVDFISAAQAMVAVVKPLAAALAEAVEQGADDAAQVGERLGALAGQVLSGNRAALVAALPLPLRQVDLGFALAGFSADASLLLMTHAEAIDTFKRRNKAASARTKPKAVPPGATMPAKQLRTMAYALPPMPGLPAPHDISDPATNPFNQPALQWVTLALLNQLAPEDASAAVMLGARVRLFEAVEQRFFGYLGDDGTFAMLSETNLPPLSLSVAGIEVALPLSVKGRLALIGRAAGDGAVSGEVYGTWQPLPGVELQLGKSATPLAFKLQGDGRFGLGGSVVCKVRGNACRIEGSADISDAHCLLDGVLTAGNASWLRVELAVRGAIGPGARFDVAGEGAASVLGMPLVDVEGGANERRLWLAGRLSTDTWQIAGQAALPVTIDANLAGEIALNRTLPNFRLLGSGGISLFGARMSEARCGIEYRGNRTLTWFEGTLRWHGRDWLGARIELDSNRVRISGLVSLDFEATPPGVAVGLLLRLDAQAALAFAYAGGLVELDARASWLIAAAIGTGAEQYRLPIAYGALPQLKRDMLPRTLVNFPGVGLPGQGALQEITLPIPELEVTSSLPLKMPTSITLPKLMPVEDTKFAELFEPQDNNWLNWLYLGKKPITYLSGVGYKGNSDTPTLDLNFPVDELLIPTGFKVVWKASEPLTLPFDEIPGFTLVLDWDDDAKRFVINGELKSPAPTLKLDVIGEVLTIVNTTANALDLEGWQVRDVAGHTYTFPAHTLLPGQEVELRTFKGNDAAGVFYWGRAQPVWNNKGDSAMLFNRFGAEIARVAASR